jgi:hypothetical protein
MELKKMKIKDKTGETSRESERAYEREKDGCERKLTMRSASGASGWPRTGPVIVTLEVLTNVYIDICIVKYL